MLCEMRRAMAMVHLFHFIFINGRTRINNFFTLEQKQEMRDQCTRIAHSMCQKIMTKASGTTYYCIYCPEDNCKFQIVYNLRTKGTIGYYLLDSSCLTHKQDCPNETLNLLQLRFCHYSRTKYLQQMN